MDNRLDILKKLCDAFGPTGCENAVTDIIKSEIEGAADDSFFDRMGNLCVLFKGKSSEKKLMLSAHTDEVGFMITDIDDKGGMKFDTVGIDSRVLTGRHVLVGNKTGSVPGIICSKAIHQTSKDEYKSIPSLSSMYIDVGASSKSELPSCVSVGSYGCFAPSFHLFGDNDSFIMSKALDDRAGCALLVSALKRLRADSVTPEYDTWFCFTVREEVGLSGARTAAYRINPSHAVVFEATAVADISGVDPECQVAKLGAGGAVSLIDNGTVYNREFVSVITSAAESGGVAYQYKKYMSGGNDAAAVQRTRDGVYTAAVSLPCRYLHSESNVICVDDYFSVSKLIDCILNSKL